MKNGLSRVGAIESAGRQLQAQYGTEPIPHKQIVDAASRLGGFARSSIIPSDFCYNCLNRDPVSASMANAMFVRVGLGMYEFLGSGYAYSGEVTWTPKGSHQRPVGMWINGNYKAYASNP
ncbi:hypothetical protein GCN78_23490 [Janthinobacterium rivuli]|uniref:DUF7225 domain-containing protein n=1 Tax=Janthinobacterium sp. FT68W TaxID=2654255 RepID=UPI0012651A46|nr:hypothetical protein [Janthinobacterium sp. FT68W]KAB8046657.1 hypothetical protein GCN78_23490 [Janthinobacterium sp. FT68W]